MIVRRQVRPVLLLTRSRTVEPPFASHGATSFLDNSKFSIHGNFEYTLADGKTALRFARRNTIHGVVYVLLYDSSQEAGTSLSCEHIFENF